MTVTVFIDFEASRTYVIEDARSIEAAEAEAMERFHEDMAGGLVFDPEEIEVISTDSFEGEEEN